jgi:hypothetical protein
MHMPHNCSSAQKMCTDCDGHGVRVFKCGVEVKEGAARARGSGLGLADSDASDQGAGRTIADSEASQLQHQPRQMSDEQARKIEEELTTIASKLKSYLEVGECVQDTSFKGFSEASV